MPASLSRSILIGLIPGTGKLFNWLEAPTHESAHWSRLAFHAKDNQERLAAYCEELARRVRQMDPQRVTLRQIGRGDIDAIGPERRANIQAFFGTATSKGRDFRLGQTPMSQFVLEHGDTALLPGMSPEKRKATLDEVRTLHRLYSISTSDQEMNTLLKAGFKSARRHQPLVVHRFRAASASPSGAEAVARDLLEGAGAIRDDRQSFHGRETARRSAGFARPRPDERRTRHSSVEGQENAPRPVSNARTLFGGVDYCECEHCKSVLSPAAYLVDLLHFIDPKDTDWTQQKTLWTMRQGDGAPDYDSRGYRKPFDALIKRVTDAGDILRRPDIPNVPLMCENTNTALPYIDIVNEILEQLVIGAKDIKAFDTGRVQSRDSIAEPQNISWPAYVGDQSGNNGLKQNVYPLVLPFDLPLEIVRAFLKRLELPLWHVRELFARPRVLFASTVLRRFADGRLVRKAWTRSCGCRGCSWRSSVACALWLFE